MRFNTPPSSPFFERDDMIPDDGEEDELVYVGDGMSNKKGNSIGFSIETSHDKVLVN